MDSCSIVDAHGCCTSQGFFWCGSSDRCTFGSDVCEDGDAVVETLNCRLSTGGVTFDLSPLSLQTAEVACFILPYFTNISVSSSFFCQLVILYTGVVKALILFCYSFFQIDYEVADISNIPATFKRLRERIFSPESEVRIPRVQCNRFAPWPSR